MERMKILFVTNVKYYLDILKELQGCSECRFLYSSLNY